MTLCYEIYILRKAENVIISAKIVFFFFVMVHTHTGAAPVYYAAPNPK